LQQPELTRIESEVAALVAQDLDNREIARSMHRTEQTVKFHITNALKKLGIRSRVGLAVYHVQKTAAVGGPLVIAGRAPTPPAPAKQEPRPERCWTCEHREVAEQAALAGLDARVITDGVLVVPNGRPIKLRSLDDWEALKTELGPALSVARTV
jgi:DNA-binding CsgD family transcriptional regulator